MAPYCKHFGRFSQTFLLFLSVWISLPSTISSAVTLTTSYMGRPCLGEQVTLTCTASGVVLQWDPSDTSPIGIDVVNTPLNTPLPVGQYTAILTSNSGGIVSTLSTTARDVTVQCCEPPTSTCESVMITPLGPPSPPQNVSHTIQSSTPDIAIVSVEWDPPVDNGGRNELNYTVNISPSTPLSLALITAPVLVIRVLYNMDYTIHIVATNCVRDSTAVLYTFTVSGCPTLTPPTNGVLDPDPSGMLGPGATVTLSCNQGFMPTGPTTVMCTVNLMWDPDPNTFVCVPVTTIVPPVICGPPQPPSNGSVNFGNQSLTHVEGIRLTYQCDDGLFPNENKTTTCRDMSGMGEWDPNPADLVCRINPANCSIPNEPLNGTILDYDNISTIEGSVITFQCNPGLTPEGVMTATCINDGVWSPDPANVICGFRPQAAAVSGITIFASIVLVALIVGVITVIVTCLVRLRAKKTETTSTQQNTPSVGPVYEDILPPRREHNIDLETNQAYGHL